MFWITVIVGMSLLAVTVNFLGFHFLKSKASSQVVSLLEEKLGYNKVVFENQMAQLRQANADLLDELRKQQG